MFERDERMEMEKVEVRILDVYQNYNCIAAMRNDLHSCLLQAYSYGKLEMLGMGSELLKLMPGKSPTSHYRNSLACLSSMEQVVTTPQISYNAA